MANVSIGLRSVFGHGVRLVRVIWFWQFWFCLIRMVFKQVHVQRVKRSRCAAGMRELSWIREVAT